MCGIAGILHFDGARAEESRLERMGEAIAHRGPDGSGIFVDGPAGLSHRRLAIIDTSPAGGQPMTSLDGRYTIVYNGIVYNFLEIRNELEQAGHQFQSRSDTEVVLEAIARWGRDVIQRLNGMFAFALWDRESRSLTLARDRFGTKPLYYAWSNGVFVFGSEIKALLASDYLDARLDQEGLLEYLTFQNFFTERTLFEQANLLPRATWMVVQPDRYQCSEPVQYWDYAFVEPKNPASRQEYIEELDRLFLQAVRRQLVSDVGLGSYLSGGLDTGAITSVVSRHVDRLTTFTAGFDMAAASELDSALDERANAEHMSYLFGTEHYEVVLKAGDMERAMPDLVWHLEEPRVGQSYPNFYASRLASRFNKVMVSGAGGDELFGGYPWRYYRAVVNDNFEHYIDKYYDYWQRLIPDSMRERALGPVWHAVGSVSPREIFRHVFPSTSGGPAGPEDYLNYSLYFEAATFLHGLLVVDDKLAMAHGLEVRFPFLDNDLVDFAMRLPARLKLGNLQEVVRLDENEPGPKTQRYFEKTRDGKLALREMLSRYLPDEVTGRVKQGFSGPDASWFKGDSLAYVNRRLMGRDARIFSYVDRETVQELVAEHLRGGRNMRLLIWSLLYLEEWCRQFLR